MVAAAGLKPAGFAFGSGQCVDIWGTPDFELGDFTNTPNNYQNSNIETLQSGQQYTVFLSIL